MHIVVCSQYDFDALGDEIKRALQQPGDEDIQVTFAPGTYFFSENHLNFQNLKYPYRKIEIDGNNATIVAAGVTLYPKCKWSRKYETDKYGWRCGVIDLTELEDVRPFGPVRRALGPIEIVDESRGLCRFKCSEKRLKNPEQTVVQITSWYLGLTYPVVKIEKGYLYFKVNNLTKNGDYYNVEGDRRYKNLLPKYQLINSPKADAFWHKGKLKVRNRGRQYHICLASRFMTIANCEFKSFEIKELNFVGNSDFSEVFTHIYGWKGDFDLHNCYFKGIRNHVISASPTKTITIRDNNIEGCYRGFYKESIDGVDTTVVRNYFRDNQLFFGNFFDVTSLGQNFRIADNIFEDFAYGAVCVGTHFASPMADPPVTTGVVENNEMYQTEEFHKEPTRTLMDSGAIYCTTSNLDVTLKNNYIHDYTGGGDNRGIFMDDGTNNVTVVRNRVERIANSYCIDMRRVASVETRPDSYVKKTNIGNKLIDNIVDGRVRWEPNPDEE